jgi:hypothetical protein
VVEGVLQDGGEGVVVLGRHDDEGVGASDRRAPGLRVVVLVLLKPGVVRLVEDRQPHLGQVDELDLETAVLARHRLHPARHADALAAGTGARGDDLQDGTGHRGSSRWIGLSMRYIRRSTAHGGRRCRIVSSPTAPPGAV